MLFKGKNFTYPTKLLVMLDMLVIEIATNRHNILIYLSNQIIIGR